MFMHTSVFVYVYMYGWPLVLIMQKHTVLCNRMGQDDARDGTVAVRTDPTRMATGMAGLAK